MKKFIIGLLVLAFYSPAFSQNYTTYTEQHILNGVYRPSNESLLVTLGGLSPVGSQLTTNYIWIGDATGLAHEAILSGDVMIDSGAVSAIGAGKVTNAMLAGSIATTKIAAGSLPATVIASSIALSSVLDGSLVTVSASKISAGSLGGSVIASSIALNSVLSGSVVSLVPSKISAGSLPATVIASSVSYGAIVDSNLAGSITPTKITGTAAVLGANSFTAAQTIVGGVVLSTSATSGLVCHYLGAYVTLPATAVECDTAYQSIDHKLYIATQTVTSSIGWKSVW